MTTNISSNYQPLSILPARLLSLTGQGKPIHPRESLKRLFVWDLSRKWVRTASSRVLKNRLSEPDVPYFRATRVPDSNSDLQAITPVSIIRVLRYATFFIISLLVLALIQLLQVDILYTEFLSCDYRVVTGRSIPWPVAQTLTWATYSGLILR